jgi:hypothetical protein
MHCHVPDIFKLSGHQFWGDRKPRILVQHHGGCSEKSHSGYLEMSGLFRSLGFNVADLDACNLSNHPEDAKVIGTLPLMELAGICSTADLFVGFDSGPLFIALGNLVPSVSIVSLHRPDRIYLPLDEPVQMALFAQNAPELIPIDDVINEAFRILNQLGGIL